MSSSLESITTEPLLAFYLSLRGSGGMCPLCSRWGLRLPGNVRPQPVKADGGGCQAAYKSEAKRLAPCPGRPTRVRTRQHQLEGWESEGWARGDQVRTRPCPLCAESKGRIWRTSTRHPWHPRQTCLEGRFGAM